MSTDVGKVFEAELEKVFRALEESHLLGWHRFPDTHSAGGSIIQPQPSDYLLGLPLGSRLPMDNARADQRMLFFEAKASEKHENLQKVAIRAEQRRHIHFYSAMLQLPYVVCHYSAVTGNIQLWDGRAIIGSRLNPSYKLIEYAAGTGRKLNETAVAQALCAFLGLPDKSKTVKLYEQLFV